MWLWCNSSVHNLYKTAVEKTAFWQHLKKWACIFTSNCLQKTMSFLVYRCFFFSSVFVPKERSILGRCSWNKKHTKNNNPKIKLMWWRPGFMRWPAGTAHNVQTKQNPSTFNKYLCTQCYIHVLYSSTVWVSVMSEGYFLRTCKCAFAIAVRCMVLVVKKSLEIHTHCLFLVSPQKPLKGHIQWWDKCSFFSTLQTIIFLFCRSPILVSPKPERPHLAVKPLKMSSQPSSLRGGTEIARGSCQLLMESKSFM